MRRATILIALLSVVLLSGCAADADSQASKKLAIEQVKAPFSSGAITVQLQADPDLNSLNGIANSCTVLIIQANKAETLTQLFSTPLTLKNLFRAAGSHNDILKIDRYAAMPGQNATLHIDRSENTRFFAIVAGYYPFPQSQHMALVPVPVTSTKSGWLRPGWQAHLTPVTLNIRLGSDSISQFSGAEKAPFTLNNTAPTDTGE
ncbi:type VI secretion system lipoprotein TssJ [Enterobacter sp. Ap-916]|uniref:type VI secretion system lipoprotein TssJ n=1 Tax=unclassified Enterobacter TaxID=2608935 RepID=UPI001422728F|nr:MULTISPECIES: type VI secretion system lipoprotein TssJ [unclassified Enterobacter]NIF59514.1 type VI secretion system lipoprotein TssJ [Enterobacter sp. Ap-867]NIG30760.1 type VI secretion system lipoprotein TssJ [Enterobacter sp. Ap-916]